MDLRLLEAARNGDIMELKNFLQEDSLVLERGSLAEVPETVLHVSAMAGQTEFVKEILKLKPDFATTLNKDGFSPIHIASALGNVEIVKELLRTSHELGMLKSNDGRSPLHFAATTGRVQVIRELFGFCPHCRDDVTTRGQTALHLAVKNNQFEAFKGLIDMLKLFKINELLNARDEDGNTILHLATAGKQSRTLQLLLGGNDIEQGAVEVNITNNKGLTALDVLDVQQMMISEPTDYMLRELLLRRGALRASELAIGDTIQIDHDDNKPTRASELEDTTKIELGGTSQIDHDDDRPITELPPQNLWHFMLKEVSLLNPLRLWKMLAKEVKNSPSEMQNALLVVAVLIATMTYQAILNPPDSFSSDKIGTGAAIAYDVKEFIMFMGPNSIGFFASLILIILLIDEFPLKALLGLAVRCMAASYVSGLLLIGPTKTSATDLGGLIIGIMVSTDLVGLGYWLLNRWIKAFRSQRVVRHGTHGA